MFGKSFSHVIKKKLKVNKKHTNRWRTFTLLNICEKFIKNNSKTPNIWGHRKLALCQWFWSIPVIYMAHYLICDSYLICEHLILPTYHWTEKKEGVDERVNIGGMRLPSSKRPGCNVDTWLVPGNPDFRRVSTVR